MALLMTATWMFTSCTDEENGDDGKIPPEEVPGTEEQQLIYSFVKERDALSSEVVIGIELKNIDEIYASNSSRAIETAKYLAETNNIKIKFDERINEREFGVKYIKDLPVDFTKLSFEDKKFKIADGESLYEVDKRFSSFINDLLNGDNNKIVIVMHGIILLLYLKTICNHFEFDGRNFNISCNGKLILDGIPKNPSIYKIGFDDNNNITNIEYVECGL